MIKNFAELQERVRSSEPLVVSVAQAADQEVLLSVKAAGGAVGPCGSSARYW